MESTKVRFTEIRNAIFENEIVSHPRSLNFVCELGYMEYILLVNHAMSPHYSYPLSERSHVSMTGDWLDLNRLKSNFWGPLFAGIIPKVILHSCMKNVRNCPHTQKYAYPVILCMSHSILFTARKSMCRKRLKKKEFVQKRLSTLSRSKNGLCRDRHVIFPENKAKGFLIPN